jgi:hypothetical protein
MNPYDYIEGSFMNKQFINDLILNSLSILDEAKN